MLPSLVVLFGLALAAPAPAAVQPEVLVFAAASLAEALTEAGQAFEQGGGAHVVFNFAGSNELARQIEAGAPAALFLSANREQVERLDRAGRLSVGAAIPLLGNTLVAIVPKASSAPSLSGPRGLLAFPRLALADPESVPAGVYARRWLEREGLWDQMRDRVVPALDAPAAVSAVASGDLPAGIAYATDARSPAVRIIYRIPAAATADLRYWLAPLPQQPKSGNGAAAFSAFLRGAKARAIFLRHGFLVPRPKG